MMWEKEPGSCRKTGKEVMEEQKMITVTGITEKREEDPNTRDVTENEQEDSYQWNPDFQAEEYILRKKIPWKTKILHQKIPVVTEKDMNFRTGYP